MPSNALLVSAHHSWEVDLKDPNDHGPANFSEQEIEIHDSDSRKTIQKVIVENEIRQLGMGPVKGNPVHILVSEG